MKYLLLSDQKYKKCSSSSTVLHSGAVRSKHTDRSPPRARKRLIPTALFSFPWHLFFLLLCGLILKGAVLWTPGNKATELSKLSTIKTVLPRTAAVVNPFNGIETAVFKRRWTAPALCSLCRAKGTKLPCSAEHPPLCGVTKVLAAGSALFKLQVQSSSVPLSGFLNFFWTVLLLLSVRVQFCGHLPKTLAPCPDCCTVLSQDVLLTQMQQDSSWSSV